MPTSIDLRQGLRWCDRCQKTRVVVYHAEIEPDHLACPTCAQMTRAVGHRGQAHEEA